MNISKTDIDRDPEIRLSGSAELRDAPDLRTALLECLDSHRATALDVSELERGDVALLQLICSARRAFTEAGVPLKLRGWANLRDTWRHAGLEALDPEEDS